MDRTSTIGLTAIGSVTPTDVVVPRLAGWVTEKTSVRDPTSRRGTVRSMK